jgi:hypothetical protein
MSNILTPETWKIEGRKICQAASLGRRKFYEKLGSLFSHREEEISIVTARNVG